MTGRRHEPLDAQERELARRLAQLDANAGPSPALDAAILAAARADGAGRGVATAPDARRRPAATRRRPRRWPMGLGIAASLAVAVGVAWQLRPQPDMQVLTSPAADATQSAGVLSEPRARRADAEAAAPPMAPGPSPESRAATDAAQDRDAPVAVTAAPDAASPPAGPARAQTATDLAGAAAATDALAAEAEREQAEFQQAARARAASGELRARPAPAGTAGDTVDGIVFDRLPPPPPPPPPTPPAPAPAEPAFVPAPPRAVRAPRPTTEAPARPLSREQQAARASAERLDEIVVSGSRVAPPEAGDVHADQPLDDQPPASADSPAVREAWLQRVRELRDAGELDAARASLLEFVRRHPQVAVPGDLRPLLGE